MMLPTFLRPVAPYTLALFRSALCWFLDRWYFTYQRSSPGAADRADDVPAFFWQAIVVWFPFGRPPIPGRPFSPSRDRWFLTHARYPQRSRLAVSPAVAIFNSALLADRLSSQLRPIGGSSSLKLCSPSKTPKLPKTTKHKNLQSIPSLAGNLR